MEKWPESDWKQWLKYYPGLELVYVIRHGDLYKIGRTFDFPRRFREIRTFCPKGVDVMLLIGCPTDAKDAVHESALLETALHQGFCHRRASGEWFRLTNEDLERIAAINRGDILDGRFRLPEGPFDTDVKEK